MNAFARKGIEVTGKRRHEGFALAGLHLSNGSPMERDATHNLHVEVTHAKDAIRSFTSAGKRLGKEIIQRLALFEAFAEKHGLARELLIIHLREPVSKSRDLIGNSVVLPQLLIRANGQDLRKETGHVVPLLSSGSTRASMPPASFFSQYLL